MLKPKHLALLMIAILMQSCGNGSSDSISTVLEQSPQISGNIEYLDTPFVTAGNRVYMVGHQNGSFPDLGWHIKGEMGGIWNHPIKLMDGFDVDIEENGSATSLDKAERFVNYPMANRHDYKLSNNLDISRWQFVPDDQQGLIVQFVILNNSDKSRKFNLKFTGHSDLRPTWLGERTNMIDSGDTSEYLSDLDAWKMTDSDNPWSLIFGSETMSSGHLEEINDKTGKGASASLSYDIKLKAGEEHIIDFVIAGSYNSEEDTRQSYNSIQSNGMQLLKDKKERYEALAQHSKLTIPDKDLEQAFEWLKYNCDWLIREVPEVGRGITAGIPDYPWWFGVDSEYALKGYMAIGQEDIVYDTIHLLDSVSQAVNNNGRIIHEMSSNGAVFNPGNINETPQFVSLIWEIYKWNGDRSFLEEYYPTIKAGLNWLMKENDADNNLFPDGFGMMEIHGLDSEMIDVASYTQRAFEDASHIAGIMDDQDMETEYKTLADNIKIKINQDFWSEPFDSYADFIGTDEQALHLIEDAIVRADTLNKPWAIEELKDTQKAILDNPSMEPRPFVLHHNWVVNTPMEMGIADDDKAIRALNTAERFVNPFGVFVTGIDRDESAGSDDGSFKGSKVFSYTGAVMTLPTGVQAVAENNYGRPDKALNYLERMTRTFNFALPGSIYEVSPDYGMMTQAWNIYSFAVPIVNQFFGIQPMASNKQVTVNPQMPSKWDHASLEQVKIADNELSVYYDSRSGKRSYTIEQTHSEWEMIVKLANGTYDVIEGEAEMKIHENSVIFTGTGERLVISER
ncbi:MAG: glycogen debranching protein [Flavobacteriaceae bacterium]|nr:glycogen debranching protein [Flavobacteriaceae bacterium]